MDGDSSLPAKNMTQMVGRIPQFLGEALEGQRFVETGRQKRLEMTGKLTLRILRLRVRGDVLLERSLEGAFQDPQRGLLHKQPVGLQVIQQMLDNLTLFQITGRVTG